jgi:hypothetical protein
VLAAVALDARLWAWRDASPRDRLVTVLVVGLAFQSVLAVTWRSARQALGHQLPDSALAAIQRLGQEPPGRVYTTPYLGTLLPAYTPHRVYAGHWFLTPDQPAKQRYAVDLLEGRASPQGLVDLVGQGSLDYLLFPPSVPPQVLEAIRPLSRDAVAIDGFVLVRLLPGAPRP